MFKIQTIIGSRPQPIKPRVVSRAIRQTKGIEKIILYTGEQFDTSLSDVFARSWESPSRMFNWVSIVGGIACGRIVEDLLKGCDE